MLLHSYREYLLNKVKINLHCNHSLQIHAHSYLRLKGDFEMDENTIFGLGLTGFKRNIILVNANLKPDVTFILKYSIDKQQISYIETTYGAYSRSLLFIISGAD